MDASKIFTPVDGINELACGCKIHFRNGLLTGHTTDTECAELTATRAAGDLTGVAAHLYLPTPEQAQDAPAEGPFTLYRTYNGVPSYAFLAAAPTLAEALARVDLYEGQGMAVAISGQDEVIQYLTAGIN